MRTDAQALTRDLGGRWCQSYGVAPCPVCQPERRQGQNALTLSQGRYGRLLLHCKKGGCAFRDVLTAASVPSERRTASSGLEEARRWAESFDSARKRRNRALSVWREAQPIAGSPAETYLRGRGITCALPSALRFHPEAWHPSARRLPAMVARVDGAGGFAAHRTYLAPGGAGKADVEPAKAMLGGCAGGAVRLVEAPLGEPQPLAVAEGIETALSLASGLLRGPASVWAALSTSGMRGLVLPSAPGSLIIAPDGDAPGRAAGHALAQRAHGLGWAVLFLKPPEGGDFNDLLTGKTVLA